MTKLLGFLFGGSLALMAAGVLIGYQIGATGYVGQQIWAWYVLPLWPMLPALTWKHFFVAGALKRLAFGGLATESGDDKPTKNAGWKLLGLFAAPWLILLVAWWVR